MRTVRADDFEISDDEVLIGVLSWADDARPWGSSAFARHAAGALADSGAISGDWHATRVLRRFASGEEVLASDLRWATRKTGDQFGASAFVELAAEREAIGERLSESGELEAVLDHNRRISLYAIILLDWVENETGPWSDLGPWRG